jgi:hypothetical protein
MKPSCTICAVYYENAPGNIKECKGCGSLAYRMLEPSKAKVTSTTVRDAKERREAHVGKNPYPHMLPAREDFETFHKCDSCFFAPLYRLNGICNECTPLRAPVSDNVGFLAS